MRAALISLAAAVACIAAGAAAFTLTQRTGIITGAYWAVTTATTVGYGDVTPHNSAGELISIGTELTTIPLLTNAFSHIHLRRHRRMQAKTQEAGKRVA
jgi:voltage-gated potassium channel